MRKICMTDIMNKQAKVIESLVFAGQKEVHMDDITEIVSGCISCGVEINIKPLNQYEALVCVI